MGFPFCVLERLVFMKTLKKILSLVLIMALLCCFVACGDNDSANYDDEDDNKKSSQSEEESPTDVDSGEGNPQNDSVTQQKKPYVIATDIAYRPFEYTDLSGNLVGVDIELMEAIAKDQGFSVEWKSIGFDASWGAVNDGTADGTIMALTITDERKMAFDFSDGYYEDGEVLITGSNSSIASWEDLSGKTLAVKIGTKGAEYASMAKDIYGFTLDFYNDSPSLYQAVANGIADAGLDCYSMVSNCIWEEKLPLKTVGSLVCSSYYGFAVRNGTHPELIEMFNKGLINIKANGEYDRILAKYFG